MLEENNQNLIGLKNMIMVKFHFIWVKLNQQWENNF